ncbi:hypothetical protein NBRC106471_2509 [Acetobacter pasteurianus subsp. pasteurianus LMG 1262 = NBRC 106471]|nr:hypothetical protein NBRC106471_2509 [Acetobacter pasteurianus subsp. pasteurianus LMG 1262 = NBRC 106471]
MGNRLDGQGGRQVGFPGSRAADQHDIFGTLDEVPAMKLADHGLVDLGVGKGEPRQVLVGGEPGCLCLVGDGAHFAFGQFRLQKLRENGDGRPEGGRALLNEVSRGLGHAIHPQSTEHDDK